MPETAHSTLKGEIILGPFPRRIDKLHNTGGMTIREVEQANIFILFPLKLVMWNERVIFPLKFNRPTFLEL